MNKEEKQELIESVNIIRDSVTGKHNFAFAYKGCSANELFVHTTGSKDITDDILLYAKGIYYDDIKKVKSDHISYEDDLVEITVKAKNKPVFRTSERLGDLYRALVSENGGHISDRVDKIFITIVKEIKQFESDLKSKEDNHG